MPRKHEQGEGQFARTTRASVLEELAKPRTSQSARVQELNLDSARIPEQASTSVPGTVEQIIAPRHAGQPERAQIAVDGAHDPHRDFRIENTFTDENGEDVRLKKGAHVEVTVTATLSHLEYPVWQESYIEAMLELNPAAQPAKIATAEHAIHNRMVGSKAEPEERQAVLDALSALKFLKRQ